MFATCSNKNLLPQYCLYYFHFVISLACARSSQHFSLDEHQGPLHLSDRLDFAAVPGMSGFWRRVLLWMVINDLKERF
jgi:hypothetical protein